MNKIMKKVFVIMLTFVISFGAIQVNGHAAETGAGYDNLYTKLSINHDFVRPGGYFTIRYEALNGNRVMPQYLDTVEIVLPREAQFTHKVTIDNSGDDKWEYDEKFHRIYYKPKYVAPRNVNYIEIEMYVGQDAEIGRQFVVHAIQPDDSNIDDLTIAGPTVSTPVFDGDLTSDRNEYTLVGDKVTYNLVANNVGNWDSNITQVYIPTDQNFELDSNSIILRIDGHKVNTYNFNANENGYFYEFGEVPRGKTLTVTYSGSVKDSAFLKALNAKVHVTALFNFDGNTDGNIDGNVGGNMDGSDARYMVKESIISDNNTKIVTKQFDVNYHNAGSTSGTMSTDKAIFGKSFSLATNQYKKTGYSFKGWATTPGSHDVAYTDGHQFNMFNLTADLDLYPVWKIDDYAITYSGNGATSGNMTNGVANFGQKVTLATNAYEKVGYTFKGWSTTTDGNVEYTDGQVFNTWNQEKGLDLFAVWEANEYTITYHDTNATTGNMDADTVTFDSVFTLSENAYQRDGYEFIGWATQENGAIVYNDTYIFAPYNIADNLDLYPVWRANTYTVTYDGNGATSGTMLTDPAVYDQSVTLSPNAFTRTGYTFKGWSTSEDGDVVYADEYTFTKWDRQVNLMLFAVWSADTYAITYDGNGATSGTMEPGVLTYDQEAQLAANAFEKTGHTFIGWSLEPDGDVEYTDEELLDAWTEEADLNLYAIWEVCDYDITYHGNGATNGSMSKDVATYNQPITLTKNTHERTGYTFVGWATSEDGDVTYTDEHAFDAYDLTNHLQLHAVWKANTYNISYDGNGATAGNMDQDVVTFDKKATLAKNAFEKTGYTFKGWATAKDGKVVYSDEQVFSAWDKESGLELFAVWEVKQNPSIDVDKNTNNSSTSTNTTKTSPTNNVQSGDVTNAAAWLACLMISLGAIVILRKRKTVKQ